MNPPTVLPLAPDRSIAAIAGRLTAMLPGFDPTLVGLLADDVVLRASGVADWAGVHRGKEAVVGYLLEIGEAFPDQEIAIIDVLTSATRIAVLLQVTIRRDSAFVTDRSTWTFTVDSTGHISDWELNDLDQLAMDTFWAHFPRSGS